MKKSSTISIILLAACSAGPGDPLPSPAPVASSPHAAGPSQWPVTTRQHIDLWLHGFAMVQDDTTLVPYFKRGYRDRMLQVKGRANAITQIDVNRDALRERLSQNPQLLSAQFLPLQFSTWENMLNAIEIFLAAEGDPARATDRQTQLVIATFAQYFPTAADRDWLRLLTEAVRDEHDRYYRSHWMQRQQDLAPVIARIDSLWEGTYHPKLRRFLSNTQSAAGSFYLSLPLDGEGRTITGATRAENAIAVTLPESPDAAVEAVFAFAHEAVGRIVSAAVDDNTTPTEKRAGVGDRYTALGLVRGGALLLQRVAPELHEGYMAYYLRSANAAVPATGVAAIFERTFPLPQTVMDAIVRQLDVVLGGI
ncbi:MAG: hypothetical protein M3373_12670 [Gemmatimonadota bacterium]|nr:hypothetical protein [Gemmatimonadota bacterium]